MTRAELAELIGTKCNVSTSSRARDSVVPPGVLVEPGGFEPMTLCWVGQATLRVIAGRADDLDVWEVYEDTTRELIRLIGNTHGVAIVGPIPPPARETIGNVEHLTTSLTVRLSEV